jgi:hypothetical protein
VNVSVGGIPRALVAGDLNDDGILDLVTAHFGASTAAVLQGIGDGSFLPAVDFWAGNAPTSVAVGHFNADGRLDVVVARLRTDQLSLLVNDSPRRGDGVVIERNIPYGSPTDPADDPYAAHHTLDVYLPPSGTASFSGRGPRYPVVFHVHGGGNTTDKTMNSYLLRSLATEGMVVVSTNYRILGADNGEDVLDVAQAFRWAQDHVGAYGGDPSALFVLTHSRGGDLMWELFKEPRYRQAVRGAVLAAGGPCDPTTVPQLPLLVFNGTAGFEAALVGKCTAFAAAATAAGSDVKHVILPGQDHLTYLANMALPDDPGRVEMLTFIREH